MVSVEKLRSLPYFEWASEDTLQTLSMVSENRQFEAGQEIFRRGDPADYLYVLTEGQVEIQFATETGNRRTVDLLGPGDLLVWSAVVEPHVSTSFGVAKTDCETVTVDAERLRQLLKEDSEFYQTLMSQLVKVVASRLTGARRQLAKIG